VTSVIVVGILLGLALLQLWWLVAAPAPDLVAEIDRWRRGRERAGRRAVVAGRVSPLGRIARWVVETLRSRRPDFLDALAPDLAITGRELHSWLARLVATTLVFGLGPSLVILLRRAADQDASLLWGPLLGLGFSAAAVVLSIRDLRTDARRRREEFTRALSIYLDLVAMSMEAGQGHAQALPAAAQIGTGKAFTDIRTAITLAPSKGITPWEALGQLGERYRVTELLSLRSSIELAQEDGARVKESLIARAATMRATRLAVALERANKSTQSMSQLNIVAALLAASYLAVPYLLALRTAAGVPG